MRRLKHPFNFTKRLDGRREEGRKGGRSGQRQTLCRSSLNIDEVEEVKKEEKWRNDEGVDSTL